VTAETNRALIHIGLHKTASTSLQQIWHDIPGVSLSHHFILKLTDLLRDAVEKDTGLDLAPLQQEQMFHTEAKTPDPFRIFTNECMSTFAWLRDPAPDRRALYFDALGDIFTQLEPNAHVLLVVREPRAWLLSMYKQYLHSGGTMSFRRYLLRHEDWLTGVLNIGSLVEVWRSRYGAGNVHILPYEMVRDDMPAFFETLHHRTGAPKPNLNTPPKRKNTSVTAKEGEFMRQANQFIELFMQSRALDDAGRGVLKQLLPLVNKTMRLEFEQYPDGRMARTANRLPFRTPGASPLPEGIRAFLESTYLPYLETETGPLEGYLESYRAALDT
jgi:hypothetical protein